MSPLSRFSTLIAVLLPIAACGGGGGDDAVDAAPPDANPLCIEAESHSDLAWIQANIFTPSCSGFDSCHKDAARMAAELNLEDGMSHAQLVGVESTVNPDYMRVVAGDPENSYLMIELGHYGVDHPAIGPDGTMPYNSPLLCVEMREAIERWIAAGAPAQ